MRRSNRRIVFTAPQTVEAPREPDSGGVDYVQAFMDYIMETGPADTEQALDELIRRRAPELRGVLMTSGEKLRREGRQQGRQQGRQEGRLEAVEGLLRVGIEWPVIESATGIGERAYHSLKADLTNGKKEDAPR